MIPIPPISPESRAKTVNLALLMRGGISEQDAGFDTVVALNDIGLAAVAQAFREAENAAYMKAADALFKAEGLNAVDLFIARDVIRSLRHKDTP